MLYLFLSFSLSFDYVLLSHSSSHYLSTTFQYDWLFLVMSHCTISRYLSLPLAISRYLSLSVAISHYLLLHLAISHCLSLPFAGSHYLSPSLISAMSDHLCHYLSAISHHVSLPPTIFHYLSLSLARSRYLSPSLTISHYVSLSRSASHYLSLCFAISHYLSLSIAISHYLSLSLTMCHYVALVLLDEVHVLVTWTCPNGWFPFGEFSSTCPYFESVPPQRGTAYQAWVQIGSSNMPRQAGFSFIDPNVDRGWLLQRCSVDRCERGGGGLLQPTPG